MLPITQKRPALACKICGNVSGNVFYEAREMQLGIRDMFVYLECAQCQCLQLTNPPSDLSQYYPSSYYSFLKDPQQYYTNRLKGIAVDRRITYGATNRGGAIGKALYERNPDLALRALSLANVTKKSRILDVGSGSGALAYSLHHAGFSHTLAIDPYVEETITYANGLRVLKKSIYEMEEQGKWDVIMFHHVFEHLADPYETLQQVFQLLAPGKICLIRIPTVSSFAWKHYQANWVQLDAPRHFFLHSLASMRMIARQTGFVLENVVYDSSEFQFWGSEQYIRGIALDEPKSYKNNPALFTTEEIAAYHKRAEDLNRQQLGDQAAFYLKKIA